LVMCILTSYEKCDILRYVCKYKKKPERDLETGPFYAYFN